MPPSSTTQTAFALEGFLPFAVVVAVGIALVVFSGWLARGDRRQADRPRLARWLWPLRLVSILVLLWMLAGPTWVHTTRSFRPKSVAVLVDRSASMGLVDPPDGSGNAVRWSGNSSDSATGNAKGIRTSHRLDAAVAQIRTAENQLGRFAKLSDGEADLAAARSGLSRVVQGLEQGLAEVKAALGELPEGSIDLGRDGSTMLQDLGDQAGGVLAGKAAEFARGLTLAALERERWVPEVQRRLAEGAGGLERLADQLARRLETVVHSPSRATNAPTIAEGPGGLASRVDRLDTFLAAAEQGWLGELRRKAVVRGYDFGERLVPRGETPWGGRVAATNEATSGAAAVAPLTPSTQIGTALQQIAIEHAAQAFTSVILLTDGGNNAGRDPRDFAPGLAGATFQVVPIGNSRMQRDVILHHTHAPKAVLQNDQVVVDAMVTAYACPQEKLQVDLLADDKVVDHRELQVTGETFDTRVQMRWKAAQLGKHALALRITPLGEERSTDNNAAKVDVQVMEATIRVLVADNFPRWETRYLLNLFKRDDRITYDAVLFEPEPAASRGGRPLLPRTFAEWSKYRVVILGDLLPSQWSAESQRSLREYVTRGGGNLILLAGKDAMPGAYENQPLGALLPVESGDRALPAGKPFYLHLTDEGSLALATQVADTAPASERVWREMTERLPIYGLSEFSQPKRTSHSLIWASVNARSFDPSEAGTRTFLSWHYVGSGRVVYLAAPVTYQLRYRQGDTFHHRFWGQLLRWAVARDLAEGSRTVQLGSDKSRYEQGEPVQVSVRLSRLDGQSVAGAALRVSAIQDGRVLQEVLAREEATRPGSYHATLEQLPVGPIRLQAAGEAIQALLAAENFRRPVETTVAVDPSGELELRQPLCNLPLLRELVDASGGMMVPPTGLEAALRQLDLEPETQETVRKTPLWNRWDLFWLFIGCLSVEWALRKYLGLT